MGKANRIGKNILLALISAVFISPIVIVFFNSFNNKPFMLPDRESFVGLGNYIEGVEKIQFFRAFAISLTITVCAVSLIILLTSMTAWYIVRVKSRFANILYFMFAFSMMVPFQMVMFTLVKISNMLNLDNLPGIICRIWLRAFCFYVYRIYQIYSGFAGRGSYDGWVFHYGDLQQDNSSGSETYCCYGQCAEYHVDLERLFAAVSGYRVGI